MFTCIPQCFPHMAASSGRRHTLTSSLNWICLSTFPPNHPGNNFHCHNSQKQHTLTHPVLSQIKQTDIGEKKGQIFTIKRVRRQKLSSVRMRWEPLNGLLWGPFAFICGVLKDFHSSLSMQKHGFGPVYLLHKSSKQKIIQTSKKIK